MYYDRRVPRPLLDLLLPDAPLGWLIPWLSTGPAAAAGAHVQTRRDRQGRRHGAIQLYLGRTSPLEVRGRPNGRHSLHADVSYRTMSPALFAGDLDASGLALLADPLRQHAERAAAETHRSFLDGEAVVHAGLMRHHGPLSPSAAPFLALDSEARMGFDSQADQVAFEATLPAVVGLPAAEAVPRKLDLVAVDHEGRLLLVEVKADPTGLTRAAWQAAVHVARFRALLAQHPAWFSYRMIMKRHSGPLSERPWATSGKRDSLAPIPAACPGRGSAEPKSPRGPSCRGTHGLRAPH